MDLHLTDKRAIVTGGSRGIGLAIAHSLAAEGVDVVIAARDFEVASAAAKEVATASGRKVVAIPTDVGDDAAVQELVRRTVDELGGVDILVNNASNQQIGAAQPRLADTTDEHFWGDVNVKVVGYLRTARAVAPLLTAQGWGRIINISGTGAFQTLSIVRSIRNVSVAALAKNLADELGPQGVNVSVVHPGLTRTEAITARLADQALAAGIPLDQYERQVAANSIDRVIDASEVADIVTFLASPRSIAINGDAILAGGGIPNAIRY